MYFFGICFILYFIKMSSGQGLRLCNWQFSSHYSGSSHSTSCSSLASQVNCALSAWQRSNRTFVLLCVLKVVLTCVLYQIHVCVNVRLLGVRVQNKRLYASLACVFDEDSHTCPTRTRIKQSALTHSR